jgi:hypothetical protein
MMESYRSNSRGEQERRSRRNRGETQWGRRTDYERDVVDPFEGQEPVEEWEVGEPEQRRFSQERAPARGQSRYDRGFEDLEEWQRPRQIAQGWDQGPRRSFGQDPYGQGSQGRSSYGHGFQGGGYGQSMNPYGRSPSGQRSFPPESERFGTRQSFGGGRYQGYLGEERFGREQEFGQGYVGKGPKGYQRSDERIREDLSDRLTAAADIDASDISISVKQGEVTLEGSVCDRSMKRAAEDLSEEIAGVREVNNRLRVEKREASASESESSRTRTGQSSSQNPYGGEKH